MRGANEIPRASRTEVKSGRMDESVCAEGSKLVSVEELNCLYITVEKKLVGVVVRSNGRLIVECMTITY